MRESIRERDREIKIEEIFHISLNLYLYFYFFKFINASLF